MNRVAYLITAAAMIIPAAAGAQTIINGSFEDGPAIGPVGFTTLGNGSTAINGWIVGGDSVDYVGDYWEAADGVRSIDLAGNNTGSLTQQLTGLTIGQSYRITFSLAGNPDGGPNPKTLVTTASNGGASNVQFFDASGSTRQDMGWVTRFYTFQAGATVADLTFSMADSGVSTPFGPALDNVSIGAVPEPAAWAMMIVGVGAVGVSLRTRRRPALAIA